MFTVETMSLPSVATLALDTWSQADGPAIGPLRVVAAVGVAVPVANALAVGIASMLTGTATSSRGKVEKQFPPKVKPFLLLFSSVGAVFDLVHDATGGCAIAGDDREVEKKREKPRLLTFSNLCFR